MADGDIGAPVDTLEFAVTDITWPSIVHVAGDIYAISYTDAAGLGVVVTVDISDEGVIGDAVEDSFTFDGVTGAHPSIVHVAGTVFAIAYRGAGASGFVVTITISAVGEIAAVDGGLLEFEPDSCYEPDMIKIPDSDGIFAIVCRGDANQGIINTISISDVGEIAAVEMKEAWGTNINNPRIVHVEGTMFAIVSRDNAYYGWIRTIIISPTGEITAAATASLKFAADQGADSHVCFVRDNIFAIVYRGPGDDGFVVTLTISATGAIAFVGGAAGLVEFDADSCTWPWILHIGNGTCVIAYGGLADDGYLCSIQIDESGQITVLDSLEYDTENGTHPAMIHVAGGQYAVAYIGDGLDGFVCTPTVVTPVTARVQHLMIMGIG